MILYYRIPGLIACVALCGHIAGTLLCISIPQITLTLPGIAGIILSIGMGVDANVITAERIKEELRLGKTLDGAIDAGFSRSFSAIFDGNITVFIVGILLLILGSASVQSFGYTLIIGVIFNFIMGITFSRLMLKSMSKFRGMRNIFLFGGAAK
jgi:protein-export membrane protein SecD